MCLSTFYHLLRIIWRQLQVVAESSEITSSSSLVNLMYPCQPQPGCCIMPQGPLIVPWSNDTERIGLYAAQRWWCPTHHVVQQIICWTGHSWTFTQLCTMFWRIQWYCDSCKGYDKISSLELSQNSKIKKILCYQGLHGCRDEGRGEIFLKISALVVGGRSPWQLQATKPMLAAAFLLALSLRQG